MIRPLAWLRQRWHARLRRIDVEILWPCIKRQTPNLPHARAAFALHVSRDPAWQDLEREALWTQIEALK